MLPYPESFGQSAVKFLQRFQTDTAEGASEDSAAVDGNMVVFPDDFSGAGGVDISGRRVSADDVRSGAVDPLVIHAPPEQIIRRAVGKSFSRRIVAQTGVRQQKCPAVDSDFVI